MPKRATTAKKKQALGATATPWAPKKGEKVWIRKIQVEICETWKNDFRYDATHHQEKIPGDGIIGTVIATRPDTSTNKKHLYGVEWHYGDQGFRIRSAAWLSVEEFEPAWGRTEEDD